MKYLLNKNGFLGIDNKFSFKEKAVIVPFGLEKTVSYGGGTRNGPKEIIKASHQVELYDEELNCEPYKKIGIKTLKPFKIDKNIKKALNKISNINKEILPYNERTKTQLEYFLKRDNISLTEKENSSVIKKIPVSDENYNKFFSNKIIFSLIISKA